MKYSESYHRACQTTLVYAEIWITARVVAAGVTVSRPLSFCRRERDEIFCWKCRLTGTSRIKAAGIQRFVMNHARQTLTVALGGGVCCLSVPLRQGCHDRTLNRIQRTPGIKTRFFNEIGDLKPKWNLPCKQRIEFFDHYRCLIRFRA